MKKFRGIFLSTIAILLPIVLIINVIILSLAYRLTYRTTVKHCTEDIITAAKVIEDFVGIYDLSDPEDVDMCNNSLSALCREFEITYSYVLKIDEKKNSETYISIGVGPGASKDFIDNRKPGDTVKGMLAQEQIDAANGVTEYTLLREKSVFDDTVVCFVPLKHAYDSEKKTFVEGGENTHCIVAAEMSFNEVLKSFRDSFLSIAIFNFALSIIMVVVFAFLMYRKISRPAQKISNSMSHYIEHRDKVFKKLHIKGNNEFSNMAREFNTMTEEIDKYLKNIDSLTKEQHMQEAELNIARNIQLGLLPAQKYQNSYIDINAYMLPAKEVGGDLYDYRITENGDVYISIADVSGKGVSAALFMSRAVTLLHMYSGLGMSPADIAKSFNNTLAQNNPNKLFITAFIAKYNPKTKTLTYTNAGHNDPYIISDKLITLDKAHCMAAGIFSDISYEEESIVLKTGDTLFMFTDGVNEAENNNKEFFSTEALEKELSLHTDNSGDVVEDVLTKLREFADGAVQSDDVTMLVMKTREAYHRALNLKSEVKQLTAINEAIDAIPDLSDINNYQLKLIAEEIFANICYYSYSDGIGDVIVIIDSADKLKLTFIDGGKEYDPTKNLLDIDTYDHNHTVGGLGKFISFKTADDYSYTRENGKNILRLVVLKKGDNGG